MCTATWMMNADGYELFVNRDEQRTRIAATPPAIRERNGIRYLAPLDPAGGGSWVAVNQFGLSVCVLNSYPNPAGQYRSRGLLVTSLMDQRSPNGAVHVLRQADLRDYRPFLLLLLAPRVVPRLLQWDGESIAGITDPPQPVTTSSFDTATVVAARQQMFNTTRGVLYHFSSDPAGGAYSVCMSRDDAQTVSFSRIVVGPGQNEFHYHARQADGSFAAPIVVRDP